MTPAASLKTGGDRREQRARPDGDVQDPVADDRAGDRVSQFVQQLRQQQSPTRTHRRQPALLHTAQRLRCA